MFRIVTDTSSNLPTAYLQAENITVIPSRSTPSPVSSRVWIRPRSTRRRSIPRCETVKRSRPLRFRRSALWTISIRCWRQGEDVLFVSMSSGISGSYASSKIAANQLQEEFPERKILTVDTYSASLAEGLVVMRAVECREKA